MRLVRFARRPDTFVRALAWLCFCLTLWPSFVIGADAPPQNAVPVVTNVSGSVTVRSQRGVSRDVISSRIVHSGDRVITGADSLAVLSLAEVGSVRLGPKSSATAVSSGSSLSVSLDNGSVCSQTTTRGVALKAGSLSITAVDDASIFSLLHNASASTLVVYQGQVSATMGNAQPTVLHQGDAISTQGNALTHESIQSVQPEFASLKCPSDDIIARATSAQPSSGGHGGGGGGILGILLGIGALAALAGGHGGGGGSGGGGGGGGGPSPNPSPSPGVLGLDQSTLSFAVDGASQQFTATETSYSGPINAKSNNTSIATVTPASGTGPSAKFTVTPGTSGSTTITVTDNHGGSITLDVTVSPAGTLTVSKLSLKFITGGSSQTFTASESSYAGLIHAVSGDGTVASVTPASGTGPGPVLFTVTPTGGGTTTITVSDDHSGSKTVSITVAGPLTAIPSSLSFVGTLTHKTFTANDPQYTGVISASIDKPSVATVTVVGSSNGPSVTFEVDPVGEGSATITITDTFGGSTTVSISVSTGALTVNPTALTFTVGAPAQTFDVSEAAYHGVFTVNSSDPSLATVSPPTGTGPGPVPFTVNALSAGNPVITVNDAVPAHQVFVHVNITGPMTRAPVSLTFNGTTTAKTISVSDPNYSGSISASSTDTTVATVDPSQSGPSAIFNVTPVGTTTGSSGATINFSDTNGGATSASVTVNAGSLQIDNNTVTLTSIGANSTVNASETLYTGPINASSDNLAVATVSPSSHSGPGPTPFTITAVGPGPATVTISDNHGGAQTVSVTVVAPPSVTPSSLSFTDVGTANAQTVNISEPTYSGPLAIVADTCTGAGIATISAPGNGPSTTSTVTPVAAGTCQFSVQDTTHSLTSTPVSVTVGPFGAISPNPTTLTFTDITPTQSFTVSEGVYTGQFTIDETACAGIASVVPTKGDKTTSFVVTPASTGSGGNCNLSVTDDHSSTPASVTITVGPFGTLTTSESTSSITGLGNTDTFTASETGYTGPINASSSNTAIATVSPASQSGPVTSNFTITSVAVGNANITVTDDHGGTQTILVVVTVGTLSVDQPTVTFSAPGAPPQVVTATDKAGLTVLTATVADPTICSASVLPSSDASKKSMKVEITPSATNTGRTTVTLVDDSGGQAVISVGVGTSPLLKARHPVKLQVPAHRHAPQPGATKSPQPSPSPSRPGQKPPVGQPPSPNPGATPSAPPAPLTVSLTNMTLDVDSGPQTFVVSERSYAGLFTITSSNAAVASISSSSVRGPSALVTVNPRGRGAALVRISDDHGATQTVIVTVTARVQGLPSRGRPVPP